MSEKFELTIKDEPVEIYASDVGRVLKAAKNGPDVLAEILDNYLNSYDSPERNGLAVGKKLTETHRTLQGAAVNFFLHCLMGMVQDYTDPRNAQAIEACRMIRKLWDDNTLPHQPFI